MDLHQHGRGAARRGERHSAMVGRLDDHAARGGTHARSHRNHCSASNATTRLAFDAIPGCANIYPGFHQTTSNGRRASGHRHH